MEGTKPPLIVYKNVEPIEVAYLRFRGTYQDIGDRLRQLREALGEVIAGDPICLYDRTADDVPGGLYIEVCYPVSKLFRRGRVRSKILPGFKAMTAVHPVASDAPWGPADWWKELGAHLRANYLTIDEDPFRELRYQEDGVAMSELQVTLQFPRWMEGLSLGLKKHADKTSRSKIMDGAAGLEAVDPIEARLSWVSQSLKDLEHMVPDPDTRGRILQCCAHRFPKTRILKMRRLYKKLGSLDALIEWIHQDKIAHDGASWYGNPVREGNMLYDTKGPASPKQYAEAKTSLEKRLARCFCPLVYAALSLDRDLPVSFCNCSAGYTAQFWEGVLQVPLRIEVLESVLKGDEVCRFAMQLPEGRFNV